MKDIRLRTFVILVVAGIVLIIIGFLMDPWVSWYKAASSDPDSVKYAISFWSIAIGVALAVAGHLFAIPRIAEALTKNHPKSAIPGNRDSRSGNAKAGRTVNIWCIAGMLLALVAILFAWVEVERNGGCVLERNFSVAEILQDELQESPAHPVKTSAIIFLVGTIVAIVSPLGSAVQAAGLAALMVFGNLESAPFQSLCPEPVRVEIGTISGALSCALLVMGVVRPVGLNSRLERVVHESRLWTFSHKRSQ